VPVDGSLSTRGQGYIIRKKGPDFIHVLTVNQSTRRVNGTFAMVTNTTKPYPSEVIWYFKSLQKVAIKVTFKGISLTNIHNNDCRKVWGRVRAELWEMNGDGSNARRISDPSIGNGEMFNKAMNRSINVVDYAALTNYLTMMNGDNGAINFTVDASYLEDKSSRSPDSRLRENTIVLKIFTYIGGAHKSCDLCSDYTENAGITSSPRIEQMQVIFINSAFQSKLKGSFSAKDGPMVVGPFKSVNVSDHFYRLHFDIQKW
jgi:hypothetical protein